MTCTKHAIRINTYCKTNYKYWDNLRNYTIWLHTSSINSINSEMQQTTRYRLAHQVNCVMPSNCAIGGKNTNMVETNTYLHYVSKSIADNNSHYISPHFPRNCKENFREKTLEIFLELEIVPHNHLLIFLNFPLLLPL